LSVTTTAGDLRRVVLRKRDGSVYVVLWRAASVWNQTSRTPVAVAPVNATVSFGGGATSVTSYRTAGSTTAMAALTPQNGAVTVSVGAAPVVLKKR
jgi:hypothetical protein